MNIIKQCNILLLLSLALSCQNLFSQDVKNFYEDLSGKIISNYSINNNNPAYPFNKLIYLGQPNLNYTGAYDGEYEIDIENLFWWYQNSQLGNRAISYQMEIVSFPFTTDCAFNLGCAFVSNDD